MSTFKPITPAEVTKAKAAALPDAVFDEFNAAIAREWDGKSATVKQATVVSAIAKRLKIPRQKVFELRYLDVEDAYRAVGWDVKYDSPAYCEDYPETFTFTKPSKTG